MCCGEVEDFIRILVCILSRDCRLMISVLNHKHGPRIQCNREREEHLCCGMCLSECATETDKREVVGEKHWLVRSV